MGMSDPTWGEIFAKKQVLSLPGRAPRTLPLPPEGPTCPEHCSGRHEHDGWLTCRKCGAKSYRIVLHEFAHQPGHYFTSLEPVEPGIVNPLSLSLRCCGESMIRVLR